MKAQDTYFLELLKNAFQFSVPIYQRTYSWEDSQCEKLWSDIIRVGSNSDVHSHFMGSIVYIAQQRAQVTSSTPLLVIDGQQRLTTLFLLLEALARRLDETEPVRGFSAIKIRQLYLVNNLEEGDLRPKLLLTQTDKESLCSLIEQRENHQESSRKIADNFKFFEDKISKLGDNIEVLCNGISKLAIVDVTLYQDQDNPQLIFESMNSTGRELSQADLIRNFVLMGQPPAEQERLYRDYWRPMEESFGQVAYDKHFDGFMRHYLTVKTGEIPKIRDVYDAFKAHCQDVGDISSIVVDVFSYAKYYCAMALGEEKDTSLANAFEDLRSLTVDVAYPVLLECYAGYDGGLISVEEFGCIVRTIESYVFRRAVCSIPTNSMNKTFSTIMRTVDKSRFVESLEAQLLILPSYRRFPSDEEFRRELSSRDLYNFRSRSYWLRRLENHGWKEKVPVGEYTIEHIMPQNENISAEWQASLGESYKDVHDRLLHTLGNLTLTAYNSEYGDSHFAKKRDMEGGFKDSPLSLNKGLGQLADWNEKEINNRANRLSEIAVGVWRHPQLSADAIDQYRVPEKDKRAECTIADHKHLMSGGTSSVLYKALREQLLDLDPCVNEVVRQLYIAFKAETNFVDVIPQAKRLVLSLNIFIEELDDPRGLGYDVSGKGRWGNGEVNVHFETIDQLPYVVGLARQAFERQMGEG